MRTCTVAGCLNGPASHRTRCILHIWAHRGGWTDARLRFDWGSYPTSRTPRHRATT